MTDYTPTDLATQILDYVENVSVRDGLFYTWMTGSATGGPNGDGTYPLTDLSGYTRNVTGLEKLKLIALGGANADVLTGLITQVSQKVTDADSAITQALSGAQQANDKAVQATNATNAAVTATQQATAITAQSVSARSLSGNGAPDANLGADGNTYLDVVNGLLYGPKVSGAWGSPKSLKGNPGEPVDQVGTWVDVTSTIVPIAFKTVRTTGRISRGDRGDAVYRRVSADPGHPGKFQDASGAWFEQIGPEWRPEQFGGFTTSTNATSAFVSADACAQLLGGWVTIGLGVWRIADFTQTCSLIYGQGRLLTRIMRVDPSIIPSLTNAVWLFKSGAVGMTVQDMTFDGVSATDSKSLLLLGAFVSDITVQRCGFENGMNRWALRGDPTIAFQRLFITDNYFKNCPQGGLIILGQSGSRGSRVARINRNTFTQVGGNICSIRGAAGSDGLKWNGVIDVEGNDNVITNCLPTGTDGPIPFEFWGCTQGQHMRNKIDTGTRGLGMGAEMQNFEIAFNDVSNQSAYAIEGGTCRNVYIHHNRARNCRTFCPIPVGNETDNLVFEDNEIIGTGLTSYNTSNPPDILFVGGYAKGLRIRRMKIFNPEYARTAIYLPLSKAVPSSVTVNGGGTGVSLNFTFKAIRVRLRTGNGGSGYTNPTVSVEGGGGSGMVITPTVANGVITGGTITQSGSGYTTAPILTISDANGYGGELEVLMGVDTVTSTGGSGYSNSTWSASGVGINIAASGTFTATNGVPSSFVVTTAGEAFGRVSDAIVDNAEITQDTYLSCPAGITFSGNVLVRNPIIKRSAAYDINHYFYKAGGSPVFITPSAHASPINNPYSIIENPVFEMTGSVDSSMAFIALGIYGAAQPFYGFELRGGGKVSGNFTSSPGAIFIPDNAGVAKIGALDTSGITGTAYNLNSTIVRKRTGVVVEGTAAPTTGTWRTGDIVEHSSPTATSPIRWQCIAGGTPGIWVARNATGSNPILSGYTALSAYSTSNQLSMAANPATTTLKIRSEATTGQGQVTGSIKLFWSGRLNNAPKTGQVIVGIGSYDKYDAVPSIWQWGDTVTTSTAIDSNGRLEVTIVFPVNAAPWVAVEGIISVGTAWSRISMQGS